MGDPNDAGLINDLTEYPVCPKGNTNVLANRPFAILTNHVDHYPAPGNICHMWTLQLQISLCIREFRCRALASKYDIHVLPDRIKVQHVHFFSISSQNCSKHFKSV